MSDLYNRLVEEGEAGLQRLCDQRAQETVTLEFKTKEDARTGSFGKDDKRHLGKALSGFANSQGGLIIWGIEARVLKDDPIDCARNLIEIADIERFESEARNLSSEYLMPRFDGIEITRVMSEKRQGAGYLLIRATRSENRPHMSKAPNDGRYYRRAEGKTFAMEHGDIEDAMSRRAVPKLVVAQEWATPVESGISAQDYMVTASLRLGIHNESESLARFPYLNVRAASGSIGQHALNLNGYGYDYGLPKRADDGWARFVGGSDHVIPPGETLWVTRIAIGLRWHNDVIKVQGILRDDAEVVLDYKVGCAGMRGVNGVLRQRLATLDVREYKPPPPRF